MAVFFCAVDVGTRSARAGLFDESGRMAARDVCSFDCHEEAGTIAEYASADIWAAVCRAVQGAMAAAGIAPVDVAALAFDATCSLVLTDRSGAPLPLGPDGRDTIAWFDHRAVEEATECSTTGHKLIRHLGGSMSPEMQTPKLMWLNRHRRDLWDSLGDCADLADHLTARAVGRPVRSICTIAAKWAYLPDSGGWQEDFLSSVGLPDLTRRIRDPENVVMVGQEAGRLTRASAKDLGLAPGIPVAAGMIDAFAGTLGMLGMNSARNGNVRLALITGTSNCVMAVGPEPIFARGIWGPYRDAILPGLWVSEGGQSASGALLDYVLDLGAGSVRPKHVDVLRRLDALVVQKGPDLGHEIHVLPDFNGNRSPLADPMARGAIQGLTLDRSFDALCILYWRAAVAISLGVRQIIEHLGHAGMRFEYLDVAGGLTRSPLLMQMFADATGLRLAQGSTEDNVLLGTAISAATAAGIYPKLADAAGLMTSEGEVFGPDQAAHQAYSRDYAAFLMMQRHREELTRLG